MSQLERSAPPDEGWSPWFSAALGVCCGFSLFYILALLSLPGPIYWPLERRWSLVPAEHGLPMLYFRQLGWGLLGACLGGVLGGWLGQRAPRSVSGVRLWLTQTAVLLVLALLYSWFQAYTPLGKK